MWPCLAALVILGLVALPLPARADDGNHQTFERWQKAVVQVQCATKGTDLAALGQRLSKGEITRQQFHQALLDLRDIRLSGAALFMSHQDRRYLITARHVVTHDNATCPGIFRVPLLDETVDESVAPAAQPQMISLETGPSGTAAYSRTAKPDLDLTAISLERGPLAKLFAQDLVRHGYEPVAADSIDDAEPTAGAELFTVGFALPSMLGRGSSEAGEPHWATGLLSIPALSFGRVAITQKSFPFFAADLAIYPGSSGGPVVSGGKLVGIVSTQSLIPLDGQRASGVPLRKPLALVVKAKFIRDLLLTEQQRNRAPETDRAVAP